MKFAPSILLVATLACRLPPPALPAELEVGRTTRAQVLLEFGLPLERYEDDRVLAYYLVLESSDRRLERGVPLRVAEGRLRRWRPTANAWMLEFDHRGVLVAENVVPLGSAGR